MIFFIHNNKNDHQNRNTSPPSLFGVIILMGLPILTNFIHEFYIEPDSIYSTIFDSLSFIETVIGILYTVAYVFHQINKK